jgi:hypothetical protein
MKSLIRAVSVAVALCAPLVSFAQSNQPLTRDEVRADLARVVNAGYVPGDWIHYPDNLEAAEARVAMQSDTSGVGANGAGATQLGQRVDAVTSH